MKSEAVADARGHGSGVLHKDVSSYPWTHYAIPVEVAEEVGFDMSERPTYADQRRDTIRKGSKGNAVAELQGLLNDWNPQLQLVVDGKFGDATKAAVEAFQDAHGLTVDGIAGPNTWCELLAIEVEMEVGQGPTNPSDCVQSPGEALDGLVPGRAETEDPDDEPGETLNPEQEAPEVAALMADVEAAMQRLQTAVRALVDSAGRG